MVVNQDVLFLLFFINFFLICFVAVFAYYTYYKRLVDLKKTELGSHNQAKKIIEDAQKQSSEIITKVEQKANEILTHSQLFKNDLDKNFKDELNKFAGKYVEMIQEHSKRFTLDYENILTSVKEQSISKSKQTLDSMEGEVKKQIEEIKSAIKEEMLRSMSNAKEQIDQYKSKEMEKIDKEIDQLVMQLAKELLRINISPKDHRKLVLQTLEKAKEQGLFFL